MTETGETTASLCPHCRDKRGLFVLQEAPRVGMDLHPISFVQCYACHAVLGVVEPGVKHEIRELRIIVERIAKQIGVSTDHLY